MIEILINFKMIFGFSFILDAQRGGLLLRFLQESLSIHQIKIVVGVPLVNNLGGESRVDYPLHYGCSKLRMALELD